MYETIFSSADERASASSYATALAEAPPPPGKVIYKFIQEVDRGLYPLESTKHAKKAFLGLDESFSLVAYPLLE